MGGRGMLVKVSCDGYVEGCEMLCTGCTDTVFG